MNGNPAPQRLGELDALRGLAALMVVLFHYTWQSRNVLPAAQPIAHGLWWGHYGVQLFFAISGFVIFMTLERTRGAADFAVSRAARLFPAYWLAVPLTLLGTIALGAGQLEPAPWQAAVNLTMLQGFLYLPSVDGVYWSLTVELAFYLTMLALWRLGMLDHVELVLPGWIALKLLWWLVPALPSRLGLLLIVEFIPWFAIGMAAWRVRSGASRWRALAPMLALGFIAEWLVDGAERALVFAAVLAVFVALVAGRLSLLSNRVLLWLGAISYPLYLLHQNLGYAAMAWLEARGAPPGLALAVVLPLALILAHLVHARVEQPAMAAIRRAWAARKPPLRAG